MTRPRRLQCRRNVLYTVAGETTQLTSHSSSPTFQNRSMACAGKAKLSPVPIVKLRSFSSSPSVPFRTSPHLPPSALE